MFIHFFTFLGIIAHSPFVTDNFLLKIEGMYVKANKKNDDLPTFTKFIDDATVFTASPTKEHWMIMIHDSDYVLNFSKGIGPIVTYKMHGRWNQQFLVEKIKKDKYKLKIKSNESPDLCLEKIGTHLDMRKCDEVLNQEIKPVFPPIEKDFEVTVPFFERLFTGIVLVNQFRNIRVLPNGEIQINSSEDFVTPLYFRREGEFYHIMTKDSKYLTISDEVTIKFLDRDDEKEQLFLIEPLTKDTAIIHSSKDKRCISLTDSNRFEKVVCEKQDPNQVFEFTKMRSVVFYHYLALPYNLGYVGYDSIKKMIEGRRKPEMATAFEFIESERPGHYYIKDASTNMYLDVDVLGSNAILSGYKGAVFREMVIRDGMIKLESNGRCLEYHIDSNIMSMDNCRDDITQIFYKIEETKLETKNMSIPEFTIKDLPVEMQERFENQNSENLYMIKSLIDDRFQKLASVIEFLNKLDPSARRLYIRDIKNQRKYGLLAPRLKNFRKHLLEKMKRDTIEEDRENFERGFVSDHPNLKKREFQKILFH